MLTKESWFPARNQKGVIGRFNMITVTDLERSRELGYEVPMEMPVLEEKPVSSNDYTPQKLPKDPILLKRFIDRYPEAWAMFQGDTPQLQGTTLDQPFHELVMNRQTRQKYEANGILLWEQIADLTDAGCQHLGFGSVKMRNDVLQAMGKPVPSSGLNIPIAGGMTAADAMATVPGGNDLIKLLAGLVQAQIPAGVLQGTATVETALPPQQKPTAQVDKQRRAVATE